MKCLMCDREFKPTRTWSKFCHEDCGRLYAGRNRRRKNREKLNPATCQFCKTSFQPVRLGQKYCHHYCGTKAYKQAGRTEETRVRRRLLCHWCHGKHVSSECHNRAGSTVKQYGTVVNGAYFAPPGVKVRYLTLPSTMHGDDLTRMLKEGTL